MTTVNELAHTKQLMTSYVISMRKLEQQAATYGGEGAAPLSISNQLDALRKQIRACYLKIKRLQFRPESAQGAAILEPSATPVEYSLEDEQAAWGMLLRQAAVAPLVRYIRAYFEVAQDHFVGLGRYKDLHDRLQHLERYYTIVANILHASGRSSLSRANQLTIETTQEFLRQQVAAILQATEDASLLGDMTLSVPRWRPRLDQAHQLLVASIEAGDHAPLRQSLPYLKEVLGKAPSFVNTCLVTRADSLKLRDLAAKLSELCRQLKAHPVEPHVRDQLSRFDSDVCLLAPDLVLIADLVTRHNWLQNIDDELRAAEAIIDKRLDTIIEHWENQKLDLQPLCSGDEGWMRELLQLSQQVDTLLPSRQIKQIRDGFQKYRRQVSSIFEQTDQRLLDLCDGLIRIDSPLDRIQRMVNV